MHSPRATYERVECFGCILNESRADTMTVVMRYHALGTARSLGHQRPVLRGFAEGTPWDKMQVMSEKTHSMLLTEIVTSFIICFVLVISMFDLGSFVMRIFPRQLSVLEVVLQEVPTLLHSLCFVSLHLLSYYDLCP